MRLNIHVLGIRVNCQFALLSSSQIEVEGEIIRAMSTLKRKSPYGIKFIHPPVTNGRAIDEYVNKVANSGARGLL